MKTIIATAVMLAFAGVAYAQDKKAEPSTTDKIRAAGEANTKAINEERAKKRAEEDARSRANIEARNKNKGTVDLPASVKKTAEGVQKKQAESKNDPAPRR
jgi:hypothetical protein